MALDYSKIKEAAKGYEKHDKILTGNRTVSRRKLR